MLGRCKRSCERKNRGGPKPQQSFGTHTFTNCRVLPSISTTRKSHHRRPCEKYLSWRRTGRVYFVHSDRVSQHSSKGDTFIRNDQELLHYQKYIFKFLKEKRRRLDIHLSELNYQFITDFERFLRSHTPTDHRRGLANNGVMKHLERLRKMIGLGIKLEWLERDPFQQYQLKFQRVERGYLTDEELSAIEKKTFSIERLQMVKNMFVFACYTGLSYSDLIQLKPENIQIGIDGESWIKTNRQKTKTPVTTPLLPEAMELILRYKNDPRANSTGTIFPCISNQKLNSYLKEIADLCSINKNLTFHLARHTFATTVTLTNGVPIETVSKMLGHTKIATTQIYARVLEKKIGEDMALLRSRMQSRKASNV